MTAVAVTSRAKKAKRTKRRTSSRKPPGKPPLRDPLLWRRVNRVQLAALIGVHPDTVTDNVRLGMPIVTRGGAGKEGVYDAVDCLAWWRDQQSENKSEAAKARFALAGAVEKEMRVEVMRGRLVHLDEVLLAGEHFVKAWTAKIRALPRQLTQAGIIARGAEPQVGEQLRQLLEEIAAWKTVGDTKQAKAEAEEALHATAS